MAPSLKQATRSVREISHLFLSSAGRDREPAPKTGRAPSSEIPVAKDAGVGRLLVDKDGIVLQADDAARQYLDLENDLIGNVLDFFIIPDSDQTISISRANGAPGIGRMTVTRGEAAEAPHLVIAIRDITETPPPR
jgi:PAS domain-containing protein